MSRSRSKPSRSTIPSPRPMLPPSPSRPPARVTASPSRRRACFSAAAPPGGAPRARERGQTGESVAAKGEVTADNQRAKTPAERLGLFDQKARAKSEKCLADAVYFEARGEAVRGQIAEVQGGMQRAFLGFFP